MVSKLRNKVFTAKVYMSKSYSSITMPFKILEREKSYAIWAVFVVFFGLINVWGSILLGNSAKDTLFLDGVWYTFAISICVPLMAETLINFTVDKKFGKQHAFVAYKIVLILLGFVLVFAAAFLWSGSRKESAVIQLVVGIIAIFISFAIYCVNQMSKHPDLIEMYDDDGYEHNKLVNDEIGDIKSRMKKVTRTKKGAKL